MNRCSLPSVAVSEQRASPGPQAREEGTEGQSDLGSPPGAVLQHLAALFHHQHGAGKRSPLKKRKSNGKKCLKGEVMSLLFTVLSYVTHLVPFSPWMRKLWNICKRTQEKQHLDTGLFLCWPAFASQLLPSNPSRKWIGIWASRGWLILKLWTHQIPFKGKLIAFFSQFNYLLH